MFRRSPRAVLASAGAVLVAVLTAVAVVSTLSSLRHQDRAFGHVHPVVVARHDLAVGTRITPADLTTRRVRGEAPEPGSVTRPGAAAGRIVRVPVLAGSVVRAGHLADRGRGERSGVVPPGRRAVRVVVEHGIVPGAGDVVDVLATFDPQILDDGGDPTVVVAGGVLVLAAEQAPDAGDAVAVTVIVTPTQARRIAFATSAGAITIALAPPEAATG